MTPLDLASACNAQIVVQPKNPVIRAGYTSDMLSDVMANAPEDSALITIQNHVNTIAVCSLATINCVIICHRRPIPADMQEAAEKEGIGIFVTALSQFEASCALHQALCEL